MTDPIHVLHVDDEPTFAEMAAEFLEREDERLAVETATSASEGLDRLAGDDFDCIVSDYDMPGQNGIEFLETIREDHPDLPFILYTGKGSEEVASDAISAGVTDYLQKGSGTSQYAVLANRIRNAVEKYSTQLELADREQRLNLFFEQSPLGVIEWDENFDFARMNDTAEEILGYTEADLVGRSWEVIVPESDRDAVADVVADLLENKGGYHSINENVRKDGDRILCEWHNRVVTDEDGAVVAIFSQFQELEEEQRFIDQALDVLEDLFYMLDPDGNITRVNDRAVEVTGYSEAELRSMDPTDLFPEDQRARVREDIEEALATGGAELEADILTKDGRTIPYEFRKSRLTDADGNIFGVVGIGRDITDRKRQERRLQRQLDQFEHFGSVLSHDLRTPLRTVEGRIELAQETGEMEHLDKAEEAVNRLDTLIEDLATVMREGELVGELEVVDIGACAEEVWQSLSTDGVRLQIRETAQIQADKNAVTRMLENLLNNAVEHGGEMVTVGVLSEGFYVEDDGRGIPEDIREEIFKTGYSTKRSDEGTGFGLSSARQIAVAHGWAITATEGTTGGARFEITDVEFAE